MTAFAAIVRVTLQQLTGRRKIFGFVLLSLIPAALLYFAARAREVEGLDTDLGGLVVSPFFAVVLPVIALIMAGSALGDERRDNTLSFLVLRPISRLAIATAKTLAACTASLGFALVGTVALAVVYAAFLVAGFSLAGEGGGFDFEGLRGALSAPLGFLAGWTHFIAFDLFVGAWILRESARIEVEPRVYLVVTLMLGPLGLGSFLLRRWLRLRQLGQLGDINLA